MLPCVTYDEAMAHLPQARWIAATAVRDHQRIAAVRLNDAEALLEAVIAGLGRSLLFASSLTATRGCEELAQSGAARCCPASCGFSRILSSGGSAGSKPP